ncbi:amidase domain-containing protein [Bacillus sp. V3B]|uniref:amidase domain-containing protein n=1 Tax=Bacillus sp. V3B TaxID=2804915 RepID=UPI0021094B74|nr:amidase domain-containing protein [Bacillus sp. V3B]MCQ6276769.1 amidase domain-containing protein [Bacillus sp. V3B]
MRIQLQELLEKRVQQCVTNSRSPIDLCEKIERKREALSNRKAGMIKVKAKGKIDHIEPSEGELEKVLYQVHLQYLIQQKDHLYLEEEIELRKAEFYKGILVDDQEINPFFSEDDRVIDPPKLDLEEQDERVAFHYNRLKAVQYAERWWNDYNPAYKKFDVDCTNYISQCLHAGEAPMRGHPNRSKGWWMQNNNWSYSWTVANSLRWYLPGSTIGLRAKAVTSPDELLLGDVICYDFQGDGRFDHSTIVTGRDTFGMPLVNAHTTNSRMRYWAYEDSTAYTPNIQYKFFTIIDDE